MTPGAEAIELNDEIRVVAQTGVVQNGAEVEVDGTPLGQPVIIDAIGDTETLATALTFDGGFIDEVESIGGRSYGPGARDRRGLLDHRAVARRASPCPSRRRGPALIGPVPTR